MYQTVETTSPEPFSWIHLHQNCELKVMPNSALSEISDSIRHLNLSHNSIQVQSIRSVFRGGGKGGSFSPPPDFQNWILKKEKKGRKRERDREKGDIYFCPPHPPISPLSNLISECALVQSIPLNLSEAYSRPDFSQWILFPEWPNKDIQIAVEMENAVEFLLFNQHSTKLQISLFLQFPLQI